jgi:hypothetical protein
MREMKNTYKIVVRKPKGKGPHRRPRNRYDDNIKMDLKEVRCEGVDWIQLNHGRVQWGRL